MSWATSASAGKGLSSTRVCLCMTILSSHMRPATFQRELSYKCFVCGLFVPIARAENQNHSVTLSFGWRVDARHSHPPGTHTLNNTGYLVRPESSIAGGRISIALSSVHPELVSSSKRRNFQRSYGPTITVTHNRLPDDGRRLELTRGLIKFFVVGQRVLEV